MKPKTMPIRIELGRLAELKRIAKRDETTVASVVRRAIAQFLEREKK